MRKTKAVTGKLFQGPAAVTLAVMFVFLGGTALAEDVLVSPADLTASAQGESPAGYGYDEWYQGIYMSLSVGPEFRTKTDDKDGVLEFAPGIVGSAALGYKLPPYSIGTLRFEFEYSRYHNEGDEIFLKSIPVPAYEDTLDSAFDINAFMFNVLFDFNIGESKFHPYVGFGVGSSQVILDDFQTPTLNYIYNTPTFPDGSANPYYGQETVPMNQDTSYVGAMQFKLGFNYQLMEHLELFAGYRYFTSDDVEVVFQGYPNQANVDVHAGEFGIRYTF